MVGYRLSSIQIKCSTVFSETDKAAACVTGGVVKAILYRQRKGQGIVFTAIKPGPDFFNCLALTRPQRLHRPSPSQVNLCQNNFIEISSCRGNSKNSAVEGCIASREKREKHREGVRERDHRSS